MSFAEDNEKTINEIRDFYDSIYHDSAIAQKHISFHLKNLAKKLAIEKDERVLDIGCGVGEWLLACEKRGAIPCGVDLSEKAIKACQMAMPMGTFFSQPAETLPFETASFDVVTCLGSLEHFVNPESALKEMIRVAKSSARILLLVPNADFLTRRAGIFSGTYQVDAKEEVRTLEEWEKLFTTSGLLVEKKWRDLHVISIQWITKSKWHLVPLRIMQALALAVWPLKWQYQVYHRCSVKNSQSFSADQI